MPRKKNYSEDMKNFFLDEQNKKKKEELEEKYGMELMAEKEDTPPEVMNEFLNQVAAFEEAWEKGERKKVIEILGNPAFKKIDELLPGELETETEKVLAKYAEHNIQVDVLEPDDVTEEAFYQFLTEELPEHETGFIPVPGMMTGFIYEEFHPSDKLDARQIVECFSFPYFDKDMERMQTYLCKGEMTFNGKRLSTAEFMEEMLRLITRFEKDVQNEIVYRNFDFDNTPNCDGRVEVDFLVTPGGPGSDLAGPEQTVLSFVFDLERSEYGGFNIKGCNVI